MSRFVISERRFGELVARKVVGNRDVDIVLADDLGWAPMLRAIADAIAAGSTPPPDPPEAREFLPRRKRNNHR